MLAILNNAYARVMTERTKDDRKILRKLCRQIDTYHAYLPILW